MSPSISNRPSRLPLRVFSFLIVLALLAGSLPMPAAAAPAEAGAAAVTCSSYHTVTRGQTLKKIARSYGMTVVALAKANNLTRPYEITVGQRLCIPAAATTNTSTAKLYFNIVNGKLTIEATGLPKNAPYYVRVGGSQRGPWIKVGRLKASKDGAVNRTFVMPKAFDDVFAVTVCLKNALTDVVVCRQVINR